ncbi:hypothetical protein GGX14DRAFT_406767 [Mycena pura]|uniref:Uncharacterized protein n=1 Tax=Mycena pura TaxID=153505 RepID=A0AAD6UTG6_9AGAR|nr:hypothetical protein GGX14DRAFT_406767 [Mycena pura]
MYCPALLTDKSDTSRALVSPLHAASRSTAAGARILRMGNVHTRRRWNPEACRGGYSVAAEREPHDRSSDDAEHRAARAELDPEYAVGVYSGQWWGVSGYCSLARERTARVCKDVRKALRTSENAVLASSGHRRRQQRSEAYQNSDAFEPTYIPPRQRAILEDADVRGWTRSTRSNWNSCNIAAIPPSNMSRHAGTAVGAHIPGDGSPSATLIFRVAHDYAALGNAFPSRRYITAEDTSVYSRAVTSLIFTVLQPPSGDAGRRKKIGLYFERYRWSYLCDPACECGCIPSTEPVTPEYHPMPAVSIAATGCDSDRTTELAYVPANVPPPSHLEVLSQLLVALDDAGCSRVSGAQREFATCAGRAAVLHVFGTRASALWTRMYDTEDEGKADIARRRRQFLNQALSGLSFDNHRLGSTSAVAVHAECRRFKAHGTRRGSQSFVYDTTQLSVVTRYSKADHDADNVGPDGETAAMHSPCEKINPFTLK